MAFVGDGNELVVCSNCGKQVRLRDLQADGPLRRLEDTSQMVMHPSTRGCVECWGENLFQAPDPHAVRPVLLQARPPIYEGIMLAGARVPRIGGWLRQPSLGRSYLLAARHVIESGERENRVGEVCLPAAYLQRHALEVELKYLLSAAYSIERDRKMYFALDDDITSRLSVKEPPETHEFQPLLKLLHAALVEIDFQQSLPDKVSTVSKQLTKDEKKQHTRFRYLRDRKGAESFPEAETVPIFERQHALEDLFATVFLSDYPIPEVPPTTFGGMLAMECDHMAQALVQKEYDLGLMDDHEPISSTLLE